MVDSTKKKIIADTHVHFYPCYNTGTALSRLAGNLLGISESSSIRAAFLTERHDCSFYSDLVSGKIALEDYDLDEVTDAGSGAAVLGRKGSTELYLFPGRQVVTREGIEILALTFSKELEDRSMPAADVVSAVNDEGGVPVVAWAPGKWFFSRGRVVRELLDNSSPGRLLLGDTTLRPVVWGTPLLMGSARSRGIGVIAGSDPLPFEGEEKYMGTYASILEGDFAESAPVTSVRNILKREDVRVMNAGKRCGALETLTRLKKNAASK